jgi:hypothetical protein
MAFYTYLSGLFWTLTYLLIIDQGRKDHTYGMPLVALCLNISWEFIFTVVHPHGPVQRRINLIWLLLDCVILFQCLRFGPAEWRLSRYWWYPLVLVTLVASFGSVLGVTYAFDDWSGTSTAFGSNLLMSVLFIVMWLRRQSRRGQSLGIALMKLLGSLFAAVGFALASPHGTSLPMLALYGAILVCDLIYVALIASTPQRTAGAVPVT